MEKYILILYKAWIKEKNGNIIKQISRLTILEIILLSLLFVSLICLLVIFVVSFTDKNVMQAAYIPMIADIVLSIVISIYTEKRQINHSKSDFTNYREHCENLEKELLNNDIISSFIPTLINKLNAINNDIEEKIRKKREYANKFMEMLLLPISAAILGALMDKSKSIEEVLQLGLYGLLITLLIYGAIIFVLFLYNSVMRMPQGIYKQFVTDLQSILDFNECKSKIKSSNEIDSLSLTDTTF